MVGAFVLPNYAIILSEMSNVWGNFTMWILVPIITIALLIIAISSMQYILVMIAFLLIIYSFIEKKIVMGFVSVLFFTYSIYLCATWEDKSLIADSKVETVKTQRETVEREKEMERRRIQEEIDREKHIKKYGIKISKEDLEAKLDSLISQEYRGSHYKVDILCLYNSSDVRSFDLAVQNEKFNDSKECKLFIGYIAKQLEQYYIWKPDFEFYTKDDGGIGKSAIIKNFRSIQNGTESAENVEFYEYEIMTKQEEKALNEKNNDNNYILSSGIDPLDRIKKLKELLDSGAITQEEYNKKKKVLLE
ncbi:SHOCT domain-containing protein [Clostridioides difficile]|nr:SHOCT domain-containing protein [Clostridioides difficile]NJK13592.1 SHOCT domain-containing protein [Clostridioides difficile]